MTSYELLLQGEQGNAHTFEIREWPSYRSVPFSGIANSTGHNTVMCFVGSDDGSDDCELTPDEFNTRFEITCVLGDEQNTQTAQRDLNDEFDLPAYLLDKIYGPMTDNAETLDWTHEESIDLAIDFKRDYDIDTDPEEIDELMNEFYEQDQVG